MRIIMKCVHRAGSLAALVGATVGLVACGASDDVATDELGETSEALRNPGGGEVYRAWVSVQDSNGGETWADDPAVCTSFGGFVVTVRGSDKKLKTMTYQTGVMAPSWSSYGDRTFNSKPACHSTDAVDSTAARTYQVVIAAKDDATNKFYASLAQADSSGFQTPTNPTPLTIFEKVKDDAYASAPALSVGRGKVVIFGAKSDGRLYARTRALPYTANSWSDDLYTAPKLPVGWTLQGTPTASMHPGGINLHTVVVRAKNAQNQYKLYFTYFKDTGFVRSATAPDRDWIDIPTGNVSVGSDPALEYDSGVGTHTLYFRSGNHIYQSSGSDQGLGGSPFTAVDAGEGHVFVGGPAALGSGQTDSHHAVVARKNDNTIRWNEPIPGAIP